MPWGRLDDGLYDHPKLDALGRSKLPAVGLWTLSISWSNRRLTDGFIPTDRVIALGGTKSIADLLVTAGMFDLAEGGYLIHDFLKFNESREQVEIRRESDRNRKRTPGGIHTESAGKPAGVQPETERTPEHPPARAGSRPVPARPGLRNPQTPASGGHGSRKNGTSPRQLAAAAQAQTDELARGKRDRVNQRQLAYLRGAITEAEQAAMNQADTPLEEIPDWAEHQTKLVASSNWIGDL